MPPRHRRFALSLAGAVPAFAVAAALALPASPAAAAYVGGAGTNCFWHYGPFGVGKGKENVAFPEGGSNYWATIYVRPPGAIIRLKGSYPRSRFMSFISYRVAGTPLDGLADYQIKPDAGSTNPFVTGSRRDGKRRSFTVDLIGAPNPGYTLQGVGGLPARNRIYLEDTTPTVEQTPDGPKNLEGMVMRVYLPDRGAGLTGGFQLPEPEVTLANGTRLTGQGACDALDSEAKQHGSPRLPDPNGLRIDLPSYRALRYPDRLAAPCNVLVRGCPTAFTLPDALVQVRRPIPSTFPAANPPVWRGAYDRRYQFQVYTGDRAPGAVPHPVRDPIKNPTRGFFSNIYNAYVEAVINRKFGKVVVLHGRLPTTPKTYGGERTLGPGQLRFYSLCSTEAVVTGVTRFCLNDEQIPTNRRGDFTVVVSRRADRPKTANAAHGIGWLEWSATGDGDLDRDFGRLVIRNLLPRPSFAQALQRGRVAGDEKKVVGPYLPTLAYVKNGAAFDRKAAGR